MTEVAAVYGQALYDLAKSENLSEILLSELTVLSQSFAQESDFLRLLGSAKLTKQEKHALLDDSFRAVLHPYVLNFLKILTDRGYTKHFSQCKDAYIAQYNLDHNILPVTAITAVALTREQSARLQERLATLTGKTISLTNIIDPQILGGVRLDYDGKRLDDTIANRLSAISQGLSRTTL